jgi:hypothetical protein
MGAFTLSQATWQGVAVAAAYGGTGQSSYAVGDLLYASGATTLSKLAAVATGQVLVSAGTTTAPAYSESPTLTGTLTANNVTADPTLGAEINTGFASWTAAAGWTYGSGKWTHSAGTTGLVDDQSAVFSTSKIYKITIGYTWAGVGQQLQMQLHQP